MLRAAFGLATRCFAKVSVQLPAPLPVPLTLMRQYSALSQSTFISKYLPISQPASLLLTEKCQPVQLQQSRSVTKFSIQCGKRKSVKVVRKSFYRLNWGIWIRAKAGKHKRIFRKNGRQLRRLQNFVFCNATQSTLLDKMMHPCWRRPKYFVDDPYEPYHTREEYPMTRKKPAPPHPPID